MANRFMAGLIALAFCFTIALPAHAQDPPSTEKKALVKELMRLMNAASNSEAVTNQMLENMREPFVALVSQGLQREFQARKLSPDEQQRLKTETEAAARRVMDRIRTEFPKRINLD